MACSLVSRYSFDDLDARLQSINPAFADALRLLGPHLSFAVARYPYGASIVDRGIVQPPCADPACAGCATLRDECAYSDIPLAIVLKNSIEVHLESPAPNPLEESPTVPLRMLGEGQLFGVFESLNSMTGEHEDRSPWSVSAGARSIWVLAPLGDRRVPELVGEDLEREISWTKKANHWRLVAEVAADANWHSEVMFLGKDVFERLRRVDEGADKLYEMILATGWRQSASLRRAGTIESELRQRFLDGPGKDVSSQLGDMYLFATASHLFAISRGDAPAFTPAGTAPVQHGPFTVFEERLNKVLEKIRGESKHYPIVLQPIHLTASGDKGFYSFRNPSMPDLRLPAVANYADLIGDIKRTIEAMAPVGHHAIDLKATSYFAQKGKYDVRGPNTAVRWEEMLGHLRQSAEDYRAERLYFESSFLVSGITLVRN